MIKLYLVRHGETVDNAAHIMQGQTPGQLNEKGVQQAHDVADKMAHEAIDVFVSSDLKRSVDTCTIIAQCHHKKVITTPLLRERDWGSFTGKYIPDLKDVSWPDDVESQEQLKARAQQFIDYLKQHFDGLTVLAVGHGIINKAIQSVHFKKEMKDILPMKNTEVRVLYL